MIITSTLQSRFIISTANELNLPAIQSFSTQISSSSINLMTNFHSISTIVENSMAGNSGALYAIFFQRSNELSFISLHSS